jgi:hypothetical protein
MVQLALLPSLRPWLSAPRSTEGDSHGLLLWPTRAPELADVLRNGLLGFAFFEWHVYLSFAANGLVVLRVSSRPW